MTERSRLAGKVAIVTGAGSGIGAASATAMAAEGAAVMVADIRADRADSTSETIRANGGNSIACTVDVSDEAQVQHMVQRAVSELGGLDILHNNAGATDPAHVTYRYRYLRHERQVTSVTFAGTTLVTGSSDKTARLWDLPPPAVRGHTGTVYGRPSRRSVATTPMCG